MSCSSQCINTDLRIAQPLITFHVHLVLTGHANNNASWVMLCSTDIARQVDSENLNNSLVLFRAHCQHSSVRPLLELTPEENRPNHNYRRLFATLKIRMDRQIFSQQVFNPKFHYLLCFSVTEPHGANLPMYFGELGPSVLHML